ncbi:hypothetical protein ACWM35_23080 [Neobacillus sp. K501]
MDKNRIGGKLNKSWWEVMIYLGIGVILFLIFFSGMIRIELEKRKVRTDPNYQKNIESEEKKGSRYITVIENLIFWTCTLLVIYSIFDN